MNDRKFTLSLPHEVHAAYEIAATEQGVPVLQLMREVLHRHAEEQGWPMGDGSLDLALYRALTEDVADAAERITREQGWREDITLLAVRACQQNPAWLDGYRRLIADENVYAPGNKTKTSVNQNFGHYVKVRLKARNKLDGEGKRMTRQVAGELVRTFTLLEPAA